MKTWLLFLFTFINSFSITLKSEFNSTTMHVHFKGLEIYLGDFIKKKPSSQNNCNINSQKLIKEKSSKISFVNSQSAPKYTFRSGDSLIAQNQDINANSSLTHVIGKKKDSDQQINVKIFGAKGDGVTDDTKAFIKFFKAVNKSIGYIPAGKYRINTMTLDDLSNCKINGVFGKTMIVASNDYGMFTLGDIYNVTFNNISFFNDYKNNALEYSKSLFFSFQKKTNELHFENCYFSMPFCNATAIGIFVRWNVNNGGKPSGYINGIYIKNCNFSGIGQSAVCIGNRDTTSLKYDYSKRVFIENNKFEDLGLNRTFGFAITFDGLGKNVSFSHNVLKNLFGIGIENTGYDYAVFDGNKFEDFRDGRMWFPFSFSTRLMKFNLITNNQCIEKSNGGINFNGVNNSIFKNNIFKVDGKNWVTFRNCNDNRSEKDLFITSYLYSVVVKSDSLKTSQKNIFINCTFDNSGSLNNFSTIQFEGAGTFNNNVSGSQFIKGAGGVLSSEVRSAENNYVKY